MDIVDQLKYAGDHVLFEPHLHHSAADEIERLREALREIYEVYANSEGIPQPMTAAEGYLLFLLMEVVRIAQETLEKE